MKSSTAPPVSSSRRRWLAPIGVFAALVALTACSRGTGTTSAAESASSPSTAAGLRNLQGQIGQLMLGDGYVREPASPDVAAAYLTIVNTGGTPARLTGVRSDTAGMVMPMTETTSGGAGSMAPLDHVVVPAHGSFRFHVGAAHLMVEHPSPVPAPGTSVSLTLTFDPGGAVTVSLPVIPIGAAPPSGQSG